MKRRAVRLAIFLFLGAMLNLLVAWGIAYSFSHHPDHSHQFGKRITWSPADGDRPRQLRHLFIVSNYQTRQHTHKVVVVLSKEQLYFPSFSHSPYSHFDPASLIPAWVDVSLYDGEQSCMQVFERIGWPCNTVTGGFRFQYERTYPATAYGPVYSVYVVSEITPVRAFVLNSLTIDGMYPDPMSINLLPWNPLWPGFIINTLLYALTLWLLLAVHRAVRHRHRILRMRCPSCGYPAGEQTICTECGKPLPYVRKPITQA